MPQDGIKGLWRVDKPDGVVPLLGSEPMLVELGALLGFRDDGRAYDLVQICGERMVLVPENPDYLPMMGESIQIAGVVTSTMRILAR